MRHLLLASVMLAPIAACGESARVPSSPSEAGTIVDTSAVHTISGIVRERHAPHFVPVPNAVVTLTSGLQAGRTARTDGSGRYLFQRMTAEPVNVTVAAGGFEAATIVAKPQEQTPDVLLIPQTVTLQWDSRAQAYSNPFQIPFIVAHWGPATLTVSSDSWYCGTYGYFDAAIRAGDKRLAATGLCQPGASSRSIVLAPGRYELLIELLPFSTAARVRVDHPR